MIETDSSGIPLPASYATALAQGLVSYDCKLYLSGYELSGDIISLTVNLGSLSDAASDTDGFMLGGVYSTSANFSIYDCPTTILNEDIELQIGVDVGNSFIYVTIAQLTVISARTAANITDAQAVGFISSKMAAPTLAGGTVSVYDLADAIYTASGVQVDIGSFNNDGEDITIADGVTCREALAKLAKHLGGYACEVNDGTVLVSPFPTSNTCSISDSVMTALPQIEDETYDVDGVTVQASEYSYIEGTGRVPVEYADATQEIADQIWDNVDGYFYTPALLTIATIDPRITPFDRATFTLDGVTYSTHTLGIQVKYDGGYFGTISAAGLSSAAEESLRTGHVESIATQAERAAAEAQAVAEATGQHFWYDTDGAHITEMTKDAWQAEAAKPNPFPDSSAQKPYNNLLMTSLGILLRSALKNLVSITRSATAFLDGLGNDPSHIVASFGSSGAQIGYQSESHVEMDYHSFNMVDIQGNEYMTVQDLRDRGGFAEIHESVIPNRASAFVDVSLAIHDVISASIDGVPASIVSHDDSGVQLNPVPNIGQTVEIAYTTKSDEAKYYTLGIRDNAQQAGAMSAAQGYMTAATAPYALAFGHESAATGHYSIAGGNSASASGYSSAAIGESAEAVGDWSSALGAGTIAAMNGQTVLGKWNEEDTGDWSTNPPTPNYLLIIGNGDDESSRSNAFTVSPRGDVEARGDIVDGNGTHLSGHTHSASNITSGTLPITRGGTGQSGVTTVSTVSTLITAASGTNISAATYKQWGKLALLQVSFNRTSSWGANAQVDIGTVKSGYRPALLVVGGNANVIAHCNASGVVKARNMTGASMATTTTQDIGFTFLLP